MPCGRPISATTIRCGTDYIEVPFFATKPSARGKGNGKALLYAIEDICRYASDLRPGRMRGVVTYVQVFGTVQDFTLLDG